MKKFLELFLIITFVVYFGLISSFAYSSEVISPEEYEKTLKSAYEKYGVEFELISYDSDQIFTQDMLKDELEKVAQISTSGRSYLKESGIVNSGAVDTTGDILIKRVMPVSKTVYAVQNCTHLPYGSADIRVEADIVVDGENEELISIEDVDAYQWGQYIGFAGWVTTYKTASKYSNNQIKIYVEGRLSLEYTSPGTSIVVGYTFDEKITKYVKFK